MKEGETDREGDGWVILRQVGVHATYSITTSG